MDFEIVGAIRSIETIASGTSVRQQRRLNCQYGKGRWRKQKGVAIVRLIDGTLHRQMCTGTRPTEAHGLGRREMKIKFPLLDES